MAAYNPYAKAEVRMSIKDGIPIQLLQKLYCPSKAFIESAFPLLKLNPFEFAVNPKMPAIIPAVMKIKATKEVLENPPTDGVTIERMLG